MSCSKPIIFHPLMPQHWLCHVCTPGGSCGRRSIHGRHHRLSFRFRPAEAVVVRSPPFAAAKMNSVSSIHMRNHMCIARRKSWSADSIGMLLQKTQCIAVAAAIDATGPKPPWLATYHTEAQRLHRRDLRGLCFRPGGETCTKYCSHQRTSAKRGVLIGSGIPT